MLTQARHASLGQMLANIAHQWRQPLTELNLTIYNMKRSVGDLQKIDEYFIQSKEIIKSMSNTIDDFTNFFTPDREVKTFEIKLSINEAVKLLDENGTVVQTTTTDADGHYDFTIRIPGAYMVEFPSDHYYTQKGTAGVDEDSNVGGLENRTGLIEMDWGDNNMTIDAGITPTAHIGDYFWIDSNQNGIQDADEKPVVGAIVELLDENGEPVLDGEGNPRVVITDENGKYGFDVPAGEKYLVRFVIPQKYLDEGYIFTSDNAAGDESDSDVDNSGVVTASVNAVAGSNNITLDAGIHCGCENVASDGADTLRTNSMLLMMFLTLISGFLLVRRKEFAEYGKDGLIAD